MGEHEHAHIVIWSQRAFPVGWVAGEVKVIAEPESITLRPLSPCAWGFTERGASRRALRIIMQKRKDAANRAASEALGG